MTVEEKNREIDLYMGNAYENPLTCLYQFSWDMLMPVFNKLRHELYEMAEDCLTRMDELHIKHTYIYPLKNAILTVDIKQAHSLIHEAIQFLNSKK